jgi:hypothetical protein
MKSGVVLFLCEPLCLLCVTANEELSRKEEQSNAEEGFQNKD